MKRFIVVMVLVGLVAACSRTETPRGSMPVVTEIAMDEKLLETAKHLPGFGGLYFDDNGDLNVYLVEDVAALRGEKLKARQNQVQQVLTDVFGKELLSQGRIQRDADAAKATAAGPVKIKLVKGDFNAVQLATWRAEAGGVLEIPGVVFTDLDERHNRIKIGIAPGTSREQAQALLKQKNIPDKAVLFEETQPVYFHASLRDHVRPMPGGVQIEADTGVFSYKICTMGFNVIRSGVSGFITNSHCTTTQGGSEGTDFHQPDDPWWTEDNQVGDETADPEYFVGGACPSGRRCRFSDSAFVDYSVGRGANIARTTGWNNGSLTINGTNTRLTIVGELSAWVDGSELDKIGRTTGWSFGRVNGTCQNINVADTNITLFCQHRVNRIAGTHRMSDNGDSGSPVFRWLGSTVMLSGILWGGPNDGSSFVFSPINQIEQELGALTTFNFPQPQPPSGGLCPSGSRCCEWELINGKPRCTLCVPTNAQCP
jgi:hypothetical protein